MDHLEQVGRQCPHSELFVTNICFSLGKTLLARYAANLTESAFISLSATEVSVLVNKIIIILVQLTKNILLFSNQLCN